MNLLIVDKDAESQKRVANRVQAFSQQDIEMMDIRMKLALDSDYINQVRGADVLLLGSGLAENAPNVARSAIALKPNLHVVMFVSDQYYSGGGFREAHAAGVRKVMTESSSPLDLLQELVSIFAEFRKEGKVREGKVICVTHAKGGTGATTMAAAMAELCGIHRRRTMLWDMDVETRDLCRALAVGSSRGEVMSGWISGELEVSRDNLDAALTPVSEDVAVLAPPDSLGESMDLICHTDGMALVQNIIDVARVTNDVIIIDTAGRITPATGAVMRAADEVMVVIDETVLGLTALDLFLNYAKNLVHSPDRITFLLNNYTGTQLAVGQIEAELEPVHHLGDRPWRLPPVPVDQAAHLWPGSGRGFYSLAQRATRAVLEEAAVYLQIISVSEVSFAEPARLGKWWEKLIRKEEEDRMRIGTVSKKPRLALPEK